MERVCDECGRSVLDWRAYKKINEDNEMAKRVDCNHGGLEACSCYDGRPVAFPKPEDILKSQIEDLRPKINARRALVVERLKKEYREYGSIVFEVKDGEDQRVMDVIVVEAQKAGWSVTKHQGRNQKGEWEGDWTYKFSKYVESTSNWER